MSDTPKTVSDTIVTAASDAPTSPPKDLGDSPPVVGDPDVVASPVPSDTPPIVPAPLKI